MSYTLDGVGRVETATDTTNHLNLAVDATYNVAGSPVKTEYGNGDSDTNYYDSNTGRLTGYLNSIRGDCPASVTGALTWNKLGSLEGFTTTDSADSTKNQSCSYTADDLGRIASVSCGSTWAQTFTYDAFGNINKDGNQSFTPGYFSATNHVNDAAYSYDANGNILTDTNGNNFSWTASGNPFVVNTKSVTYDALGRTVEIGSGSSYTQIVYRPSGAKLAVLQGGTTLVKATIPLPGGGVAVYNSSGFAYFRHADWLGSSRLATKWDHSIYSREGYAPYGESYNEGGTMDRSFTGQDQDTATGLYDFLYRRYNPVPGRWISPDPAGMAAVDPTNPQTWNRYAYVGNSPLNVVDPRGLDGDCNGEPCTGHWGDDGLPFWYVFVFQGGPWQTWQSMFCMLMGSCSNPPQNHSGGGGGGTSTPAKKDITKTWGKTFPCNKSAQQVMAAVQNDMGQFADNRGALFAADFPAQPIQMGGQYTILSGVTDYAANSGFASVVAGPFSDGMLPANKLVVTVTSQSATGWTFTTDPSHHYFDGTVSFSSTNAGNGNITFSVTANANFSNFFYKYVLGSVIKAGENSTWNNMLNTVQEFCRVGG